MKYVLFWMMWLGTLPLFAQGADATPERFSREGEVVLDRELALVWQDDARAGETKVFFDVAQGFCRELALQDRREWRLPTFEELQSIGDYDEIKPVLEHAFMYSGSGYYWSVRISPVPLQGEQAQRGATVYFSDGTAYDNDRTGKAYVRCVHSADAT